MSKRVLWGRALVCLAVMAWLASGCYGATVVPIEGDAGAARADGLLPGTAGEMRQQYKTYGGRLPPEVAGEPGAIAGLVLSEGDYPLAGLKVIFNVRRAWGISCSTRECEEFAKPIHSDETVTDDKGRFALTVPGDVIYEKARLFLYEVTVISSDGKRRTFIYRGVRNGRTAFKELRPGFQFLGRSEGGWASKQGRGEALVQ